MKREHDVKPTIVVEPCGWTPAQGLVRAACWLVVATVVAILLMWPIAEHFPRMVFRWAIRATIALLTAWMMFGIAQSKASFVGPSVSAMAIAAASAVMLSHHFAAAGHVFLTRMNDIPGNVWLDWRVLLFMNIPSAVAIGFCTALRHDGGGDANTLLDIFMRRY